MENEIKVALVVPSIREASFARFVEEWSSAKAPDGSTIFDRCRLILVEDNPTKTFEVKLPETALLPLHFCWDDIERFLGDSSWVIPRRSDTVRSFGYWLAWSSGFEYIMTLDDDCYPQEPFFTPDLDHLDLLRERTRWFSTLNDVKPRGVPYNKLGRSKRNVLNHGLWTNVLDYDAPTQLVAPNAERFDHENRTVPAHVYYPMCGMNLMWRADATFAMYHLLMGSVLTSAAPARTQDLLKKFPKRHGDPELTQLPFDRFGDIWAGILSKKLFDEEGFSVSTGTPYIHHDRASDPFTNLRKEANGLQVNESFWEYVDEGWRMSKVEWNCPLDSYRAICQGATMLASERHPEHATYFNMLHDACMTWCNLFESKKLDPSVLQRIY